MSREEYKQKGEAVQHYLNTGISKGLTEQEDGTNKVQQIFRWRLVLSIKPGSKEKFDDAMK